MRSRHRFCIGCGCVGMIGLLVLGCGAPQSRETVRMRDLRTPAARKQAASHFWLRTNVPDMRQRGYQRIAIAEFVVEFVTDKRELTTDLAEYLKKHPEMEGRAGGAVQNIEVIYPNEHTYPTVLYEKCRAELMSRGFEVVPISTIVASSAYHRFETEPQDITVNLSDSYAGASDTGRVRKLSVRAVPGLMIIRGGGDQDPEGIAEDLRLELKADVLLRVRIRVGTFSGHATMERGSIIHVTAPHVSGTITAQRSLISEESVIAESKPVLGGWQGRVSLPRYRVAVDTMFPVFVAMAFDSADAAPAPDAGWDLGSKSQPEAK